MKGKNECRSRYQVMWLQLRSLGEGRDITRLFKAVFQERTAPDRLGGGKNDPDGDKAQLAGRCFAQKEAKMLVMFLASKAISRARRKARKSSATTRWSRWGEGRLARAIAPNAP